MSAIMLQAMLSICFVAGKSGGHLLPCITQAKQLQSKQPNSQMYIFSTGSQLDHKIINKHKDIQHYVPALLWDVPYGQPWLLPFFACNVTWYFCKSIYKLWQLKPEKVISFGGFNSVPVCLAAKLLKIPFEIYELNVEPGKATKLLAYCTDTIFICFEETKKYFPNHQCILFDYPVRFKPCDKETDKEHLLQKYNFSSDKKTILILGGSQGSTLLNQVVKNFVQSNPDVAPNLQFIHQTGDLDYQNYADFYQRQNITALVFGYHEGLQDFYNIADLIISRAGAGSLFEIKFFEKPCICVPHETANTNHQIINILTLQKQYPQQFTIIKQADFNSENLKKTIYSHLNP